jgi:hypothetical protein
MKMVWRINAAAWIARVAPASFLVASVFAGAFYALRRAETPLVAAWAALIAAFVITMLLSGWRARRQFYSRREARVLLESQLRLDTRLTAAELGLVPWPTPPAEMPAVLQWRLGAPFGWFLAAAALLIVAVKAPVPPRAADARPTGAPPALLQTQEMIASVKELNVADPQAIQQLDDRAVELARRPMAEQYSHSALEAADALRDQTTVSAAGLARALEAAAEALRAAQDDADMTGAAGQLSAALEGLRDGKLPANKALLSTLPASAGELKSLSATQRSQLAQQLRNAAKGLRGIRGAQGSGAEVAKGDADGVVGSGDGPGGDSAPLMFAPMGSDAGEGTAQALTAADLKRFALGDKLGTTTGAHKVDPNATEAPMAAGAVAAPASGGEAVWVNRLTPAERAALKQFFR